MELLGWLRHDVSPEELAPGDHIYKWGSPFHTHHGLVLEVLEVPSPPLEGGGELLDRIIVLHLNFSFDQGDGRRVARVHRVPLRGFLQGGSKSIRWSLMDPVLKRARYGVPRAEHSVKRAGTCYLDQRDTPEVVLARGRRLLEASESRPYDFEALTTANCEHMVVWCTTGCWKSSQVDGAAMKAAALAAAAFAAVAGPRAPVAGAAAGLVLGGALLAGGHHDTSAASARLGHGAGGAPSALGEGPPEGGPGDAEVELDGWELCEDPSPPAAPGPPLGALAPAAA